MSEAGWRCRGCGAPANADAVVLDLGQQPDAGRWPAPGEPAEAYPLRLGCCPSCGLAQLIEAAPEHQELIGVEPQLLRSEATRLVAELAAAGWLPAGGTVREFASPHGGSWLPELVDRGLVPIDTGAGGAAVVVDSLGLMHDRDQRAAMAERAAALAPGGVLLIFAHSLAAIVAEQQWNAVRHGHYAYYSLAALETLLGAAELVPVEVFGSPLYGRCHLVVCRHRAAADGLSRPSWREARAAEPPGLLDPGWLRARLEPAVQHAVQVLREHLVTARAEGRRVYAYAAASRAVPLLNRAGIDATLLRGIGDAAQDKQGRLLPGTDIEICSVPDLLAAEPDEVLVLVPDLLTEVAEAWPELSGRLLAYRPGARRLELPDGRVTRFTASNRVQQRLHELVPGGAHTYARGSDQYPQLMAPVLVRGRGALVWDADNNCLVEYGIGLRSVTLGHAHPQVSARVRRILRDGTNFSRPTVLEAQVAERFVHQIPGADRVKFAKNGSDVTTAAVKLARAHTGREVIAIADQSFFSVDDWWIGHTEMDRGIPPGSTALGRRFPFNDLGALAALLEAESGQVAAVLMQPATATEEPAPGYLRAVRELCDRHQVVLIFDEIVTGYRWSISGVQGLSGVVPDLACWGKGIGNGFPIAALTGRAELLELGGLRTDQDRVFTLSTTNGPESVGLAAVAAVAEVYADQQPMRAMQLAGEALRDGINAAVADAGLSEWLRVVGHPACLMFQSRDAQGTPSQGMRTVLLAELIGHGVLGQSLVTCAAHHDSVLIEHTVAAFAAALPSYRRALESGPEAVLAGAPVAPALRRRAAPRRLR